MISRVAVIGDLVEVWKDIDGDLQVIRRHVQNYATLTDEEKKKLWEEIAQEPLVEYPLPEAPKPQSFVNKLKSKFHLK